MQKISVLTTQNVRIDYVLAGIGDRILAYLIDGLVVAAYLIIVGLLISQLPLKPSATLIIPLAMPFFLYHLLCEILLDGQSLGKMQMGVTEGPAPVRRLKQVYKTNEVKLKVKLHF